MASDQRINEWFLNHSDQLSLKIGQGSWIKQWIPKFHDFKAEITINETVYTGRGIDQSLDIAFTKACVEAVERYICDEHNIYSTGVAGYHDIEQAKLNAKFELLERDAFLSHYLTKTPMKLIEPEVHLRIDFIKIQEKLKEQNVKLEFYKLSSAYSLEIVLCLSILNQGGFIIGLSCSTSLAKSQEKAFLECLSNTVAYLEGHCPKAINEELFLAKENTKSLDHFCLNLNDGEVNKLETIIENNQVTLKEVKMPNIEYEALSFREGIFNDYPLEFVRAKSNHVQNIFYGKTQETKLNIKRLNEFTLKEVKNSDLEFRPHPIG
jgi:hypothetical protein